MPEFDFEWEILGWTHKSDWGAIGTVRTPSGDTVGMVLQRTLTSKWFWHDWTPEVERIPENEQDGNRGSYVTTDERSGNLEVRLAPYWQDWRDGNFDANNGFPLQPGLVDHVGDRIHFYGVDSGELIVKATAVVPDDYMERYDWMTIEELETWPYAGLDVLSSYIAPDKLAEIWPHIQAEPKKINVIKRGAQA